MQTESESTTRRVYESPDVTFIKPHERQVLKHIPPQIRDVPRHVTTLSTKPVHSYLDALFGCDVHTQGVHFEPPPGMTARANGCFSTGVLPSIQRNLPETIDEKTLTSFLETLTTLEKMFEDIRTYMLRFCKG